MVGFKVVVFLVGGAFLAAGGGFEGVSWGGSLGDGFGGKVGQKVGQKAGN